MILREFSRHGTAPGTAIEQVYDIKKAAKLQNPLSSRMVFPIAYRVLSLFGAGPQSPISLQFLAKSGK